jgi:hypothetical protein
MTSLQKGLKPLKASNSGNKWVATNGVSGAKQESCAPSIILKSDTETYHGDQYFCVFDLADEVPIAYTIFPELAQFAAPQRLPDAGVVQEARRSRIKLSNRLATGLSSLASCFSAVSESSICQAKSCLHFL